MCSGVRLRKEPHENGPLFVEKHFYVRNANKDDIANYMKSKKLSSLGMPTYFGNGSHDYKGEKYRYLVLERYGKDLWSLFKECGRSFPTTTVFQLGLQMLDVLEYIHSRGYVHADIKGANILLGLKKGTENQAYLVDFGLATRVNDKEFKPDPKCAHNGTIEYTSRDAHLGVSTMRGDLEILGYNMLQWIIGELPWEKVLTQPKKVQEMKESFLKNVRSNISKQDSQVPDALIKFFEYINSMKPKDTPDYNKCRSFFESYLKSEGKTRTSKLEFTPSKKKSKTKSNASLTEDAPIQNANGDAPKAKRGRKPAIVESSSDADENQEPESPKVVKRKVKRKSTEPSVVVKVKKTKMTPKATPPVKKNHVNTATQTSMEKPKNLKRSPRQVSFDSPVAAIIGDNKSLRTRKDISANSSGDIFEDSFEIQDKKIRPKKRLLSDEEVTVKRVVKKKVTTMKPKKTASTKSWKDLPTVVNGRSPPK
ncbi:nucleosomal histone kinase 1-like isoform X2 [Pectinophora gossypiella]|uniref:nucleosomal histone kinase 1-like isoform X2 n=1 Tax=Pectinophora gossypiella TaxID=13191 RepID=UPI00214DF7F3|nr:nucleosomal histone kinase 1-like isoform X2 [Pectinophora gossypiella]